MIGRAVWTSARGYSRPGEVVTVTHEDASVSGMWHIVSKADPHEGPGDFGYCVPACELAPIREDAHGYETKRFPLTAAQGRVLYHAERLFRSAGGNGCTAAVSWRDACAEAALPVLVSTWTNAQCVKGLHLIEWAARKHRMHLFRDVRTQWEPIAIAEWRRAPEEYRAARAPSPLIEGYLNAR